MLLDVIAKITNTDVDDDEGEYIDIDKMDEKLKFTDESNIEFFEEQLAQSIGGRDRIESI